MLARIANWYRSANRARRDLVIIAALAVPLYLVILIFDAFDVMVRWTIQHASYELEEFLALLFCLGLAGIVYSYRRVADLRQEIAQRHEAEQKAHRLARHDPLTGLPNRRRFVEDFETSARDAPHHWLCALMLVDLDRFKPINDLYGHRLGDEVLRVVADRLRALVKHKGIVARLGGDEFGILLRYRRGDDVPLRLASRIISEIPKPIPLAALSVVVGASVGVAVIDPEQDDKDDVLVPFDGSIIQTALRQADRAMYRAKTEGRGLYRFYDSEMDERMQQRVQLEREIRGAIAGGEIVPCYQPIVDLRTQDTVGYEVLARWRHPTRGVLPPAVFIPVAEDTGSIEDLTLTLLRQAVEDVKARPNHPFLSINLSPRQFADAWLPQKVLGILRLAALPPHRLQIEISETAVEERLDEARATLQSLRHRGIKTALDDFGIRCGALYHLRDLPLDSVKIDRSLISQMLEKPEEGKIVEAIISLAHTLGLNTVAEGIESEAVLDKLAQLGCETGQGYLFGSPEALAGRPTPKNVKVRQIA